MAGMPLPPLDRLPPAEPGGGWGRCCCIPAVAPISLAPPPLLPLSPAMLPRPPPNGREEINGPAAAPPKLVALGALPAARFAAIVLAVALFRVEAEAAVDRPFAMLPVDEGRTDCPATAAAKVRATEEPADRLRLPWFPPAAEAWP